MTAAQSECWQKIQDFAFDPPQATFLFEDKLIQQTGWPRSLALRAIAEYRRYLLIAARGGHPVSPSPIVDEVWHLHLLYTRGYWDNLCKIVLEFPFHHEPAIGTTTDRSKLDDWYTKTRSTYRDLFDQDPPADIWPAQPVVQPTLRVDPNLSIVLPRKLALIALLAGGIVFIGSVLCLVLVLIHGR